MLCCLVIVKVYEHADFRDPLVGIVTVHSRISLLAAFFSVDLYIKYTASMIFT